MAETHSSNFRKEIYSSCKYIKAYRISCFVSISKQAKSRAAWNVISAKVIAKLCSGDYNFQDSNKLESAVPQPRITSHSRARSSTSVCAATTSAPTLSSATASALPPLTRADKANVAAKYDSMDVEKMWKLSTGTIVEQKMRECAMNESREQ